MAGHARWRFRAGTTGTPSHERHPRRSGSSSSTTIRSSREGIAGLLDGQAGHEAGGRASNGREAIQQFRTHRPDVTLMDLQMPEMSGLDAIIAIRGEFPEARIIVLTTYAGDVQMLRALKAGARATCSRTPCTRNCWTRSAWSMREEESVARGLVSRSPSMPPTTR